MKTLFKILPLVALIASCGAPDDAAIKKKIQAKKNQIARMETQISELEKELSDTTDTKRLVPVSVKEMLPEEFNHYIIVYGKVEADNYALISPEMPGQISGIHVSEGQFVSKGELLISLNTDAISNQISATKTNLELATTTYEKQEALWKQGVGSEIQFLQAKSGKEGLEASLKALEAQKRMSQIRAPFSGTVNKIFSKKGELAGQMMPVLEMVNLSKMSVSADISESYMGHVKKGDIIELSFPTIKEPRKVQVSRVSKVINQQNRAFEIEAKISNANQLIKPNMVSTVRINDYHTEDAMVIPSLAMRNDIKGNYVYVVEETDAEQVVAKKYVVTGKSYDDKTEVIEGLVKNDKVITKGFHMVSNGMPVNIVE